MHFAKLMQAANIDTEVLVKETGASADEVARWSTGISNPPGFILRSLEFLAQSQFKSGDELTSVIRPDNDGDDSPKLVSLFAGTGGLDIGLEMAGFRTVLANELAPHACESLRANKQLANLNATQFDDWFDRMIGSQRCYNSTSVEELAVLKCRLRSALTSNTQPLAAAKIVERDVRALSALEVLERTHSKVGELTLIAGGAPCQPFSRAGKQETVNCDDGRLFLEFVRLVDETRPRWFLFENVKGLVQHRTDVLFATCRACNTATPVPFDLRSTPTQMSDTIGTCMSCGRTASMVLEWEKRRGGSLEIIQAEFSRLGYACQSIVLNARDFGIAQDRERLFIVGSRDNEKFDWPAPTHRHRNAGPYLFDAPLPDHVSLREAILADGHWRYGNLDERAVLWVKNVVRPHDEPVTWSLDRVAPTIGAHQAAKLAIAPYGVPDAQLARQQWHTLGRRQGDTPPVFVEHEYLTDAELLTLQSFPKHWYLHGTRMERAFQIGNAVPPRLAQAVGEAIIRAMADGHVQAQQSAFAQ